MEEKKVLRLVMIITCGLALTTLTTSQLPATCHGYERILIPCVPYFVHPGLDDKPTSHCCKGAKQSLYRAMGDNTGQGVRNICDCLRGAVPYLGFHEPKLIKLPEACEIKLTFSTPLCVLGPPTSPPNQNK